MSGIAVMASGPSSGGLMPRYLRPKEDDDAPARAPAAETLVQPVFEPEVPQPMREVETFSVTEELRRRIADAGKPAPRRARPLWFGLAAVAVIVVAMVMFPDTVAAFLPDVDPTP